MNLLRRALLSSIAAIAMATTASADPAMWRVSDADSDVYLFGSVHLFIRDTEWRTSQFDTILKSAEHVYFEVVLDVDAYATITYLSLTKGRFTDGQSLDSILTDDQWHRLAWAAERVGLDVVSLGRFKPWFAAMMLGQGDQQRPKAGVDILIEAEVGPERRRGLETPAEQMGYFIDAPLQEQVELLMSAVEAIESGEDEGIEPLFIAWEEGDMEAIHATMAAQLPSSTYKRLIDNRNVRWVPQIEQLLADNDRSLIIVGAGHLVGPGGVPALLEAKGYTVERIDGPPAAEVPTASPVGVRPR